MLDKIGVSSVEELFRGIPDTLRFKRPLNVPPSLSEIELEQHMTELARANVSPADAVCFLGGGSYDHFIPAVVDAVAGRSEYYTAYTPYQAKSRPSVHSYLADSDARVLPVPTPHGWLEPDSVRAAVDEETLCVIVQHPSFFGGLEEVEELAGLAHDRGALFIVSFDPISLGLLKRPGQYQADIAVAEGQCLGNPMAFGGPYLGILACRDEFVRKMPGRLVGQTVDRKG